MELPCGSDFELRACTGARVPPYKHNCNFAHAGPVLGRFSEKRIVSKLQANLKICQKSSTNLKIFVFRKVSGIVIFAVRKFKHKVAVVKCTDLFFFLFFSIVEF